MFSKLESLRGIAACLVILFHSPFNFNSKPIDFVNNSYLFVDFFFILSGFVMSYAYGSKISKGLAFQKYIILRLGRIYPLHLFTLIIWLGYILAKQYLYLAGYGGGNQYDTANLPSFISNILLIHSMGVQPYLSWNYPSWSISAEFIAYLIFFIFSLSIDKQKKIYFPLFISLACYLYLFYLGHSSLYVAHELGFVRCIAGFYLGVFLFRLYLHPFEVKSIKTITILEVLSVSLLIFSMNYATINLYTLTLTLFSFTFVLLTFSAKNTGLLGGLLETKFMRNLGLWSYSIYMLHAIIIAIIYNIFKFILKFDLETSLGFLAITVNITIVLITIVISKYSYIYIEDRFRKIIKTKVDKLQPANNVRN